MVTMQEIRDALTALATPELTMQIHRHMTLLNHHWVKFKNKKAIYYVPPPDNVSSTIFEAITKATTESKVGNCGIGGSGGIYAMYLVWLNGEISVDIFYSPVMVSNSIGPF